MSAIFVKTIGLFQEDVSELAEILYLFQQPLVVSHEKFANSFEVVVTPHRQALDETIDWYRGYLKTDATATGQQSLTPS